MHPCDGPPRASLSAIPLKKKSDEVHQKNSWSSRTKRLPFGQRGPEFLATWFASATWLRVNGRVRHATNWADLRRAVLVGRGTLLAPVHSSRVRPGWRARSSKIERLNHVYSRIRDSRARGKDRGLSQMGRERGGNLQGMDASRSSSLGGTTSPVANTPTFAAPLMRRMARRLSSPGKRGPTKQPSSPPKQKCTRTGVWKFRVKFRSTPSVSSLAALSRSTRWAAGERCPEFKLRRDS